MRNLLALALLTLPACAGQQLAGGASACASDPAHWARTPDGCLAMEIYGPPRAEVLVVVLHGDVSRGGPATYHKAFAKRIAETLPGAASVALIRPGYTDGDGRISDGSDSGRFDHYTQANIDLVAGAIADLRSRTGARRIVAVGHSGGSATAADVLVLHPGTIDAAILLACPCDLTSWRANRQPWTRSISPITVSDQVPRTAKVAAYTGTADGNTGPSLAQTYIQRLTARGVDAKFTPVAGATHNGIVEAVWSTDFAQVLMQFADR